MHKESWVMALGLTLVVLPALGIPDGLRHALVVAAGVLLLLLGYLLIRDRINHDADLGDGQRGTDTFIETTGSLFEEK